MIVPAGVATQNEVLRLGAAVESRSEHPIGRAICERANALGIETPPVTTFTALPGRGAEAYIGGRVITVGNATLFAERGIERLADFDERVASVTNGTTVVFVAAERIVLGAIAVADTLRPTAREAIELLRAHGIERVVMLTGDQATTARQVASSVGIDEAIAGLLPSQKHAAIEVLRASGPVVMVGDGINDAPALAAADVGIAMGAAASDVALETADVALLSAELLKLPYAIRLARATLRNVKTNVALSLVLKAAFLILAITGQATLWMAVLADTGATVIVVANALRLLRSR